MNRLHHLEKTLPLNIATVIRSGTYDSSEFVVLDYGSRDGVNEWFRKVKRSDADFFRNVRMFSCTDAIREFRSGEAKNTCHMKAKGVAVCNIDADTLLMPGYDEMVFKYLIDDSGCFISPPDDDFYGKTASKKDDFIRVGGYNERMAYSIAYDDTDLVNRLQASGLLRVDLPNAFKCRIEHSIAEKLENVGIKDLEKGAAFHHKIMEFGITWRDLSKIPVANTIEVTYA